MHLRITLVLVFVLVAFATMAAWPNDARAVILNCPREIAIKPAAAQYPWSPSHSNDAILHFAQASFSCVIGTCTLSCGYATPTSVYNLLVYKVPAGVCNYTNDGHSFVCSSIPPPRRQDR